MKTQTIIITDTLLSCHVHPPPYIDISLKFYPKIPIAPAAVIFWAVMVNYHQFSPHHLHPQILVVSQTLVSSIFPLHICPSTCLLPSLMNQFPVDAFHL